MKKKTIPPKAVKKARQEKKTFAKYLSEVTGRSFDAHGAADIEPLAAYTYARELQLKQQALEQFWRDHSLPPRLEKIIPSEKSREYRTTSKRRVLKDKGRFILVFHRAHKDQQRGDVQVSALEPPEHRQIFEAVAGWLNHPNGRFVGDMLNFVIIRGSYRQFALVLNLRKASAPLVRKARELIEKLRSGMSFLQAAVLVFDDSGSDYYLPGEHHGTPAKFLFGPKEIPFLHDGIRYAVPVLSFSQINLSLLPKFIDEVANEIPADPSAQLIDMFCGYGLFTLAGARKVSAAKGYEGNALAVATARELAKRNRLIDKVRFFRVDINARTIQQFARKKTAEYFIVDPPRSGCAPGFVRALCARGPEKVIHIFCGMDVVPREINQYHAAGYRLKRALPLDLFPGTTGLELVCTFEPQQGLHLKDRRSMKISGS